MVRLLLVACFTAGLLQAASAANLSKDSVNSAELHSHSLQTAQRSPTVLRAQILLDRAHVSPGVIDGRPGDNTKRALAAYAKMHNIKSDGTLNKEIWQELIKDTGQALTTYEISKADVEGPFIDHIPSKMQDMAKLKRMAYTSPTELLAAKFHMDEDLLKALNEGANFSAAGTKITVADVDTEKPKGTVDYVEANKQRKSVIVYGKDGKAIAYYPASVGSKDLPSPSGNVTVEHIVSDPKYYYHPSLGFNGVPDKSFTIPAGPNNPVGLVWIGLSKPHYGIHGTPDPAKVGKAFSHGCVHLTNWDAKQLASLINPGTHVIFEKSEKALPRKSSDSEPSASAEKQ